jgi:ubiquitin carboxyl-terminal hydrolase 48
MRFTYGNNGRIKSKAAIKYNTTMRIGGLDYALKAVVTHEGSSAHHGHFTADVYDES